jgi:hypothetical protein
MARTSSTDNLDVLHFLQRQQIALERLRDLLVDLEEEQDLSEALLERLLTERIRLDRAIEVLR